jgi:hypothetical protein
MGSFVAGRFFQRFVNYLMYLFWFISSFCFDELFLHVVENISLTYAKFSCSLFMIDGCFSHVMTSCTIQGSPKVCTFLSDLFASGYSKQERCFWQDGQIDQNASWPKNLKILALSRLQHQKNQVVTLMNSVLCTYIHCLCSELAIYLVLHGASKILPCPSWYK